MKNPLTPAQLIKMAKDETDTVRAAHFQRQADGAGALKSLTEKSDEKRRTRNKMIDGLPAINPIVESSAGPNAPQSNDVAVLQAQVKELQAQLAGKAA